MAIGFQIERKMLGRLRWAAEKLDCDAHVSEGLHVCEGTETGIAGLLAGYRPVWALGSAGDNTEDCGIAGFPVLAGGRTEMRFTHGCLFVYWASRFNHVWLYIKP